MSCRHPQHNYVTPYLAPMRYTAANVEFWEHHGEATVDWFGTELVCTAR